MIAETFPYTNSVFLRDFHVNRWCPFAEISAPCVILFLAQFSLQWFFKRSNFLYRVYFSLFLSRSKMVDILSVKSKNVFLCFLFCFWLRRERTSPEVYLFLIHHRKSKRFHQETPSNGYYWSVPFNLNLDHWSL
jgi:hypothetical protein